MVLSNRTYNLWYWFSAIVLLASAVLLIWYHEWWLIAITCLLVGIRHTTLEWLRKHRA